ncbi:MAG: lipid A deacylase LpxR family protein [Bacteroidota bacterium]
MRKYLLLLIFTLLLTRCNNADIRNEKIMEGGKKSQNKTPSSPKILDNEDVVVKSNVHTPPSASQGISVNQRKKSRGKRVPNLSPIIQQNRIDSSRISQLKSLQQQDIEPDLNEPLVKNNLLSATENGKFPSMILLSSERFFRINFDNDILDYTDRFYTNGVRFELISPAFHGFLLSKLMVPYWRTGINYYGITLAQNIYTPSTTKIDAILVGDRPYSGYIYFGNFKITNDLKSKYRQSSELDLGIIGPASMGEAVQKSFHSGVPPNSEPLGWEYQIHNDIIVNYSYSVEKGLISRKGVEFNLNGSGNFGTLYTNIGGGFTFRTGRMNPYFCNLGLSKRASTTGKGLKKFQAIFFLTANQRFIGYDATLQGGLFNQSSPYYIRASNISRFVFQGTAGLSFSINGFRLDIEQFLLSPEYHQGLWHKWIHMCLWFAL